MPPVSIYLSYAPEDESFARELQPHLTVLRRMHLANILDNPVRAGSDWQQERDNNLNIADIIVLLISPHFFASDYIYSVEMRRALERHERGEARVIPILVRPTDWEETPLKYLRFLPTNRKPIALWPDRDEAYFDVARGIRQIVEKISYEHPVQRAVKEITPQQVISSLPREAQDALKFGQTAFLRDALELYYQQHNNERLVVKDKDGFLYYENLVHSTYIWQIWQTLVEAVSQQDQASLLPLIDELTDLLTSSLSTTIDASVSQKHFPSFWSTSLDVQHVFTNLHVPEHIPLIFYTGSSFDMNSKYQLRTLMRNIAPSSRVALFFLFMEPRYQQDCLKHLKQFQKAFAYDIIPVTSTDFLRIADAKDPRKAFRQLILSQADLSLISPFITSGPTSAEMFFGREQELRAIQEHARTTNYALIGGRRIGKTSILKRLLHFSSLPEAGFSAFYQDCSYTPTQAELVQAVSLDPSWFPTPPSPPLSSFASILQALPRHKPIVFLLDEADKLIEPDRSRGYPLLNTLRGLANAGHCHFVFSGEYALRSDMHNDRSPLYNFANELPIGNLDARAARELILQPMHDMEIELENEEQIVSRILNFTAGHPNVIQRLGQHLVMRINRSHRLRLGIGDVEAILANSDFLRNDFLETYWGQATLLERLCTLVMVKHHQLHTLLAIHGALTNLGLAPTLDDVDEALNRLVNLRNLLHRMSKGEYEFAVTAFPEALAETYELDDLIALTCEKYRQDTKAKTPTR